jgi:hypothetical protein
MVLASEARGQGRKSTAKCAICKTKVKSFNVVYIDLDADDDDDDEAETKDSGSKHERTGAGNNEDIEELKSEWQQVYQELTSLLLCDDDSKTKVAGHEERSIADDFQGTQDVHDICATIDLTQSPGRVAEKMKSDEENSLCTTEAVCREKDGQQQPHHQKRRIQKLFARLHHIHTTLIDLTPSSKSTLKSKFLALQKTITKLQSQIDVLTGENNTIQSKLNKAEQSLFDRNVQAEKERRKLQEAKYEYAQLLEVHSSYQNKCMRDIDTLKASNAQLRKECDQLKTVSGLADVQEMEEITEKYKKMSQQLHDVLNENRVLKRRMEERERRRGEMDRIRDETGMGSRKVGKENVRCDDRDTADFGSGEFRRGSGGSTEHYKASTNQESSKSSGSSRNSNRAMDILNTAPSRKSVQKKSNLSQQKKGLSRSSSTSNRNQVRDISRWDDDEEESDSEPLDVQLFLKQKSKMISRSFTSNSTHSNQVNQISHPLSYQRNDSVSSVASAATASTKRMLQDSATLSRKSSKHGHPISSYFKPR